MRYLNLRISPSGLLPELLPTRAHCDKPDFEVGRALHESNNSQIPVWGIQMTRPAGGSCNLACAPGKKLVAIKQASNVAPRVTSGYLHFPESDARRWTHPESLDANRDCYSHSEAGDIYSPAVTAPEVNPSNLNCLAC